MSWVEEQFELSKEELKFYIQGLENNEEFIENTLILCGINGLKTLIKINGLDFVLSSIENGDIITTKNGLKHVYELIKQN